MTRPLDFDQLLVLLAVVEHGSFSAAARKLHRAQSAVTYAVQELEADIAVSLFDRSAYRPVLSEAGRALLPRVRRVLSEAEALQAQAAGIAGGLESSLTLVVDSMFPMAPLTTALTAFQARFPSVATRVHVESLGAAADMVVDGQADIGLVMALVAPLELLDRAPAGSVELVAVCAPTHPLARLQADRPGPIARDEIQDHLQLVLTDRSPRTREQEHGVAAATTWRLADLGAKHAMLRVGLGWGSLPRHVAGEDLDAGRLTELRLDDWVGTGRLPRLECIVARKSDRKLGPAGQWLFVSLVTGE